MEFELYSGKEKILDPEGSFVERWNKVFLVYCVLAIPLDAFFFYAPVVNPHGRCLDLDRRLQAVVCILRSLTDLLYILHIIFQFRTGFRAPSSRVFGSGELVVDPGAIARRYFPYSIIDILSILPLPQVVVFIINPRLKGPVSFIKKDLLKYVILTQLVPRLIRIYPMYKEVSGTSVMLIETAWAGAAINLFFYMLASHVIGAYWYLLSVERQDQCWRNWCTAQNVSNSYLYCGGDRTHNDPAERFAFLNASCPLIDPAEIEDMAVFNFGIFIKALRFRIVETRDFPYKFCHCFWWALRNISSLGSNLETSPYIGEVLFAVFISIAGLILFSLLVGNMQKYLQNLQSMTTKIEEEREKRKNTELWMSHRMLPEDLRGRVRRYRMYKWKKTKGVDENELINDLPKDLHVDIKRHLCLSLIRRVPLFQIMDSQVLYTMCYHLKPVLYTEHSTILCEGDPVDEMLFIMRGKLSTITTNGGRTGFFNEFRLKAGDFCGEELLTWVLESKSSSNLPISTRTVKAITEVEAFGLKAYDLKIVASQFFHRLHSKQFQHTFRQASNQKQISPPGNFPIKLKILVMHGFQILLPTVEDMGRLLHTGSLAASQEEEVWLQDALSGEVGTSPSLGATIFASRFAAKLLRSLRQNGGRRTQRLPPLMPQRPSLVILILPDR